MSVILSYSIPYVLYQDSVKVIGKIFHNTLVASMTCPDNEITVTICPDFCQSVSIDPAGREL